MKALSLTQPWASLVVSGAKRVETRSWSTRYRGPLAIHASRTFPPACRGLCFEEPFAQALIEAGYVGWTGLVTDRLLVLPGMLPRAAIIGVVNLVDVRPAMEVAPSFADRERAFGLYAAKRWAWMLEDAEAVAPIACRGALGLWEVSEALAGLLPALPPLRSLLS